MAHEEGPSSTCVKAGQDNPAWGKDSQKPAKWQRQVLILVLAALQREQATHLSHTCLGRSHGGSLTVGSCPFAPSSLGKVSVDSPIRITILT